MLELIYITRFKRDLKLTHKRGIDISLLASMLDRLRRGETLEAKYRDHALAGSYLGFRGYHIQPDWLLTYLVNKAELILTASRTGSHSDPFQPQRFPTGKDSREYVVNPDWHLMDPDDRGNDD